MRLNVIGFVLLLSAVATGDTPQVRDAAEKVVTAFRGGDQQALRALAGGEGPDPWLVADTLCQRGDYEAAGAFAAAAARPGTERLRAYVDSRRDAKDNSAGRRALSAAAQSFTEQNGTAVLAVLEPVDTSASDVVSVRVLYARGLALKLLRRFEESHKVLAVAAKRAIELGWAAHAAKVFHDGGLSAFHRSDVKGALEAWQQRLSLEESLGNGAAVAETLGDLGAARLRLGDYGGALQNLERALKLNEELGERPAMARALVNMGVIHMRRGASEKALKCYRRALGLEESLGNRAGVARALQRVGVLHKRRGEFEDALECYERALALARDVGDQLGAARALGNIGNVHLDLRAYRKAMEHYERALPVFAERGDRAAVAIVLGNIGVAHENLRSYPRALEYLERAFTMMEELGDRSGVARTLGSMGSIHVALEQPAKALAILERSLELAKAIGDAAQVSRTLVNIGAVHETLGDYGKALECQERSLEIERRIGNRIRVARALGNVGNMHYQIGDFAKALACARQSLEIREALGDRVGIAAALTNIGLIHEKRGDYAEARDCQKRSLALKEELGDRAGMALVLGNLGSAHFRLGAYPEALACRQRALAICAEVGALDTEAVNLWGLAETQLALGAPVEAIQAARLGVRKMGGLVGGLAEGQAAVARDRWKWLFEIGVAAAVELESPAELSFFLESGRAGALVESLGHSEPIRAAVLPPDLHEQELRIRAVVREAEIRHARALRSGRLSDVRTARAALDSARGRLLEMTGRAHRAAKAAAGVVHPAAAELPEIQAVLESGEALISYFLARRGAVALVVTRDAARIARLGATREIEAAVDSLSFAEAAGMPTQALDALRRLVIAPLGLDASGKRLLVSPHKRLAYIPFAALLPRKDIAYVPSGTTLRLLRTAGSERGERVLALGDPAYATRAAPTELTVFQGRVLPPLPQTGLEAKAVGDVILLRKEATKARLAAELAGRRWRAVHLACHGLIDPERPLLSSLALTPGADDHGLLTTLDVFRTKIPADLVVLSACETGRGKVHEAEGIVGFTNAFMFAGSPRVLVSLWKVDDAATRALMVRFYELWRAKEGARSLSAATALRKAQEHVRAQVKWAHPYYWAAWQLWGLPG